MEIIGTGIDLVENARIASSIERFGESFLARVFTDAERAYCSAMREPAPHYAVRFAAKEAVSKAFGCGIGELIGFRDIEVIRTESGAPQIELHGNGKSLAEQRGVARIFISLSHTAHYSVASVTLVG